MPGLVIAADDRTGALEVAGACADRGGGRVPVQVLARGGPVLHRAPCVVVDLGGRHLDAPEAAARAELAEALPAAARAHKIDSLLRGNWAAELVARQRASGRRILVAPALPSMGRICRGGVVLSDGVALSDHPPDARTTTGSSRPADHLVAAGATDVVELGSSADVGSWTSAFAVVDAATPEDLESIAAAWRTLVGDVVLAGTAAAIGAAVVPGGTAEPRAPVDGPILVVCGSLHPAARRQLDRVAHDAAGGMTVLASPEPSTRPVTEDEAVAAAARLAAHARRAIDATSPAAIVVVGGDTAAAVLGDAPRLVGGTVMPGAPWSFASDADGPLVVTRAGSFGGDGALVELVVRLRRGSGPSGEDPSRKPGRIFPR